MLSQKHRFHGLRGLSLVHSKGQTIRGQQINLRVYHRSQTKPYRVAVVVSRKVHKSAVVRNRIRRRIYAAVRNNAENIVAGTDMVFMVYSDRLAEMEAARLEKAITELIAKASPGKASML